MYDRQTDTLWHQLWGTPAFGPLVGSGLKLERLPVTLTTWEAWYAEHPDTKVMSFDTGFTRDYSVGAAYAEKQQAEQRHSERELASHGRASHMLAVHWVISSLYR